MENNSCPINQDKVCEEKFKTLFKRLDIIEKLTEQIHNLSLSVENLAQTSKNITERLVSHDEKIKNIERYNFNRYKDIIKILLSAVIGGIITYLFKRG